MLFILSLLIASASLAETPSGAVISNTVLIRYSDAGGYEYEVRSNTVQTRVSGRAVLSVAKSVSVSEALPGEAILYAISYRNGGNGPASQVTITDQLPPGLTFASATDGGTFSDGIIKWDLGILPAGASGEVQLSVRVADDVTPGTSISNVAVIDCLETDPIVSTPATITVKGRPSLKVEKDGGPNPVFAGDEITYTISYENTGLAPAENVILTDPLPQLTSFVLASNGGSFDANAKSVIWPIGRLEPGDKGSVQLVLKVDPDTPDGMVIRNISSIRSDEGITATSTPLDITVYRVPSVEISKELIEEVTIREGEETDIGYVIRYRNADASTVARNVLIIDDIPTPVATFINATGTYSVEKAGDEVKRVKWSIGDVPPGASGEIRITLRTKPTIRTNDAVVNTGSVRGDNFPPLAFAAPPVVVVRAAAPTPKLEIVKTVDKLIANPGDTLSYVIRYRNSGDADASDVVIEDELPQWLSFMPNSATQGGLYADGKITWELGPLPYGEEWYQVAFQAKVNDLIPKPEVFIRNRALIYQRGVAIEPERIYSDYVETRVSGNSTGPSISLVADPDVILGDGKETSTLTATVYADADLKTPPPAGTKVTLTTSHGRFPNGGQSIELTTDENGVAVTQLTAELVGDTYIEAQAVATAVTSFGAASDTVKIIFYPGAISGMVTDFSKGNAPIAGLSLIARDRAMVPVKPATTGEDGRFMIFIPKPNLYVVTLDAVDHLGRKFQMSFKVDAKEAFGRVYHISNAITGCLIDPTTGGPISDVKVRIRTSAGVTVAETTTDQSGMYLFEGLVPDLYTIETAKVPEGYKLSRPVQVDDRASGQVVLNVNLQLERAVVLTVTKSVDRTLAIKGDILTYTISYLNTGGMISDAELIDELPANVTFVQASDGGRLQGGVVRWTLGQIPTGGSGDVKLVVKISETGPDSFTLTNVALVRSTSDPTVQFRSNPVQTLVGKAAISVEKRVDRTEVKPGEKVTFTISYRNTGSLELNGITLTDSLPQGLSPLSVTGGAQIDGGKVSWNIDRLLPGTSGTVSLIAQVDEGISSERRISNIAIIAVRYPPAEAQSTVEILVKPDRKPVFDLSKVSSRQSVSPGDVITYTIKLRNTGSAPATNVVITDLLPPQLEYIGAGDYDPSTGRLKIEVGTLSASSDELTFQYTAKVASSLSGEIGSITNTATVSCSEGITATTFSSVKVKPALTLRKSADKEYVSSNELVTYTITYRNVGGTASDVVVMDRLPEKAIFVEADPRGNFDEGTSTISWHLNRIEAGEGGDLKVTVRIAQSAVDGMVLKNMAHMSFLGGTLDSNEVTLRISNPRLILAKRANVQSIGQGEEIRYIISFENKGSSDATNVVITDMLPDELSFVSATGDPEVSGRTITWRLEAVPAGGSGRFELVARVSDRLPTEAILNTASILSDQTARASASSSVDVRLESSLSFSKLADKSSLTAGEIFSYSFEIRNDGPGDAHNLKVVDPLPGDVEFLRGETGGLSYDQATHTVTFEYPTLLAGERISASFEVRVKPNLADMKTIQNTATLSSDEVEGQSASVSVSATPIYIRITKSASRRTMEVGDFITYTLTIRNTSDKVKIDDLTLMDALPESLSYIDGSAELDGRRINDPAVSNGRLVWKLGGLDPLAEVKLVYRAVLDPGLYSGELSLTNVAWAEGLATKVSPAPAPAIPTRSDEGRWTVMVRRGIFAEEGVIIGKVFVDEDEDGFQDPGERGMPYVKLIMEDGTVIVTDEFGKYSVPEVKPGYHVLKLDLSELPEGYSVVHSSTRDAGDPTSQFAYMMSGGLEKIDFALKYTPQPVKIEVPEPKVIQPQAEEISPPQIKEARIEVIRQPVQITVAAPVLVEPELDPDTPRYISPRQLWESRQKPIEEESIRLETPAPMIVPPKDPPEIEIESSMFQIPPGDPKLTVTIISPEPISEVRGRRLDGKELEFNKENGKWVANFTVPFKAPDGPYPFEIEVYDLEGVRWDYITWVMVDSTIPIIYGEFLPRSASPGEKVKLKVNLLVEAEEVTATIGGRTMKLNRINPFHWWMDYTIPSDARSGRHAAEITVVAKEEMIRLRGVVTYRVR
jgi:uncharacterized repeat protein (TIGR01451 family)